MKAFTRFALASGASILAVTPAHANHGWNGYHWATTGTGLSLTATTSISDTRWNNPVAVAIANWATPIIVGAPDGLTLIQRPSNSIDRKRCPAIVGQVVVCHYAYGQRGWLGIATIWLSDGHINKATAKLNDSYFNSGAYNTPEWRNLVSCQEIAHTFGLSHQDENFYNRNLGSCMDYTSSPAANQQPNFHDYEQIGLIYLRNMNPPGTGHDDGYTSATSSAAATDFGIRERGKPAREPTSDELGDSPAEWGQAIRFDGLGRPDMFAKNLGAGRKKVTHVFWAPGERPRGKSE